MPDLEGCAVPAGLGAKPLGVVCAVPLGQIILLCRPFGHLTGLGARALGLYVSSRTWRQTFRVACCQSNLVLDLLGSRHATPFWRVILSCCLA